MLVCVCEGVEVCLETCSGFGDRVTVRREELEVEEKIGWFESEIS